jgi:Mrp family chromosome partitioning ATPase
MFSLRPADRSLAGGATQSGEHQPVDARTTAYRVPTKRSSEIDDVIADAPLVQHYRQVITTLRLTTAPGHGTTIGVTSALYDEGAPSVVIGLATALAFDQIGSVMLIDCDLGWPTLDRRVGVPLAPGVGELVGGLTALESCVHPTSLSNLQVIPAGKLPQRGPRDASVVRHWLREYARATSADYVVVNLPPANVDPGTTIIATAVDALVLTVLGGSTPRASVEEAILRLTGSKLASIVVNGAESNLIDRLSRPRPPSEGED